MSARKSKIRTDAGIFPSMVYETLQNMGVDVDLIFSQLNALQHPIDCPQRDLRYDNRVQKKFWELTEVITQNSNIGLTVGHHLPTFRGQLFEYIFLSSANFGDALKIAMKYYQYFTTGLDIELHIKDDTVTLRGFHHPVRHYLECTITIVLSFFDYISQGKFQAQEIWLSYDNTEFQDLYHELWHCPVYFNQPYGCIKFKAEILEYASPSAQPDLFLLHQSIIEKHIELVDKHELVIQIEEALGEQLKLRQFALEDIARILKLSPRKIQISLKDIGTNYENVLTSFRQKLARQLLAKTALKHDEIVYLTGFSEPSAFSRAFKYWTGESPSSYRQRIQNSTDHGSIEIMCKNSKAGSS